MIVAAGAALGLAANAMSPKRIPVITPPKFVPQARDTVSLDEAKALWNGGTARVLLWADPDYAVVHSSIVACNAHMLQALAGQEIAETTGEDNVKTLRLTYSAYESARSGKAVHLS